MSRPRPPRRLQHPRAVGVPKPRTTLSAGCRAEKHYKCNALACTCLCHSR